MQAESRQALLYVLQQMQREREKLGFRRDDCERELGETNSQLEELERRIAAINQDLAG